MGADMVGALLSEFLSGGFGRVSGLSEENAGFLSDRAMSDEDLAQYLEEHRFPAEALVWRDGADGTPVLRLDEEQWGLVQSCDLNLFCDDGAGYIDLGLDNVFDFDDDGGLLGKNDGTWLAVNGQPVAYYHVSTMDDGVSYAITGRVPILYNGSRAELILVFDDENPHGFAAGVQSVYLSGETDTVAKSQDNQDSYLLGEPLTVTEEDLVISDVPLEGRTQATYRFTDFYGQHYWTPVIPEE